MALSSCKPCRKPIRHDGYRSVQPSSLFAFAFEAPGAFVISHTPASPINGFASQVGTRRGGLAPTAFASSACVA